ncbi:MAG: hypothetical protein Q4C71_06405, partial [Microbacteriaceae bacterium]|nr:hypothetical protein [Microbacteriaceae bacterium]
MSEKSYKQGAAFVKTGKALVVNGLAVSLLMGATTSAFAESTVNLAPAQSVAAQNTPVNKDVTAEDVAAAKAKLDQLKQ